MKSGMISMDQTINIVPEKANLNLFDLGSPADWWGFLLVGISI